MSVQVTIDQGRLARLLRARGGVAEQRLRARTERVEALAKREAPGHMGDFITSRIDEGSRGLRGVIVCTHPAVRFVLDGTRPHLIRPRKPGGVLRFEAGGRTVFARYAHHPGTKPNNFMSRALREGR